MAAEIFEKVNGVLAAIKGETVSDAAALEAFRIKYLGTKNTIKPLFGEMRNIPNEQKKEYGQLLNTVKQTAEEIFAIAKEKISAAQGAEAAASIDLTAPHMPVGRGSRHPVSIVMDKLIAIFERIGFVVVLRTHTSSVQARTMTTTKPPIRIIAPGRVYRNETISARSHCQFHQVEGLYVDENVSFADMKQTLLYFAKEMYGPKTDIRLRPSYFPFTEPSAEMDVWLGTDTETTKKLTKGTGWLEVLGCGMVDPNVLENCGIDSEKYSGFAFGIGIERSAMQRYGISDIRLLFENDTRFLKQFSSVI